MFLNCHTAFSFKYGTLKVDALFEEARRCGVRKLILTEINNTASYIEMLRMCKVNAPFNGTDLTEFGKPAWPLEIGVGVEFRKDNELLYVAIAKNNEGFERINRFLSFHNAEGKPLPTRAPVFEHAAIVYPFGKIDADQLHSYEYIGIAKHQLHQFALHESQKTHPEKFVILHPVTFAGKIDFNVHRLLRAIDNNTLLSKLPPQQEALPDEIMMPEERLEGYFSNYPALIENTRMLMSECSITFELKTDKNKKHVTGSVSMDWDFLVTKAWKGFEELYDVNDVDLRERFQRELNIIRMKGFCGYYLVAYDLVCFAKE